MKINILILIFALGLPCVGWAVPVCLKNNVYIAVLNKGTNGTVGNVSDGTFSVDVPYETISGTKKITGTGNCSETIGSIGKLIEIEKFIESNTGTNCYCTLTVPIHTHYVYLESLTNCAATCASRCANAIATNKTYREYIFESVW